ncbi:UDP-glucuronosyl/UDP-glucosyltransferase [Niveomyces insectorum RCEF 264]|uniref:UDP-glucuronosyl/UDP-glucosyltransferase n=1 Tax=Niveomyces insectorum RCEF 264 TaxID=1081102 RepID=A0A167PUV4_9HYPO|nr:UDP-glucuronosyl/UDP-glucosyltransferase [Niveomyces insectorum RCEF 264]
MVTSVEPANGTGTPGETAPLLVFLAATLSGHMAPVLHIAREMMKRGFGAAFLSSAEFKESIEQLGAEFWETAPVVDEALAAERKKTPLGPERLIFDFQKCWIPALPRRHQQLKSLLETVRRRDPTRKIIVVPEVMSLAALPFVLGAPLPEGFTAFPPTVALNVIPLIVTSVDTAPFGVGLPPDATESGRQRNQLLNKLVYAPLGPVNKQFQACLAELGCTRKLDSFLFDTFSDSYDTTFQMCSASFEYPRSDLAPNIRFAGVLPHRGLNPDLAYPSWWAEITENAVHPEGSETRASRKKVVAVAQGTIATSYDELILPTIQALAKRTDIIVIAILGVRGASLPGPLPSNVRVLDYFPYDAVLAHADLFVTNGGYGSCTHSIINGVPMVVGGITEDKVEVTARAEYAGLAVNLRTQTPSADAIAAAVDKVLGNPAYKTRAERLRLENADLDPLSIIERQIRSYAKGL